MSDTTTTVVHTPIIWAGRQQAISKLLIFLTGCATHGMKDWHVVFSCGTVARVASTVTEQVEYPATRDFGEHRIEDPQYKAALDQYNRESFKEQIALAKLSSEEKKVVKQAYHMLYSDGYPYPGGEGADRNAHTVEFAGDERLYLVLWPSRNINIFNLAVVPTGEDGKAAMQGGELRRYDVLQPRITCIISPQAIVTCL